MLEAICGYDKKDSISSEEPVPKFSSFINGNVKEEKGIDPMAAINEYGSTLFGEAIVGGGLDTVQHLMSQKDVTYDCSDQGRR
ncbi:hypothetical protein TNIN_149311 [Trichonephila inaurata madagascariensis]|uniref:Uncharacterized protein n=1 Tax=Trichonephila inaurata madagascariensis TaxID=2747483 RepID=A0A8X7CM97_9ARAC|nr:hypothetical protein TNIN_149311 [Trichonephila inaurata madagascariensis]